MRSESPFRSRRFKRWLPWGVWAVALAVALPLCFDSSGLGVAPAAVEVKKVTLGTPRTVRLSDLLVAPGEAVKAGQVLARLDPSEVDAELAIARAEERRLRLSVSSQEVSLREDRNFSASRLAGEAEQAALDVSRLVAEAEQNRGELAQLVEQIAREEKLVAAKLARTDNLNTLNLRRAALSTKVDESRALVQQARANAANTAKRLAEWRATGKAEAGGTTSSLERQLAPGLAQADAQKARIEELERVRGRLELQAPFDGHVAEVLLRPGEIAPAAAPVVSVVADRPTGAVAYVSQRWAGRIQVGDLATLVASDRSGTPRHGKVKSLGAAITELPERFRPFPSEPFFGREVFIELDEPAPVPGQAFDATFHRGAP